MIVPLISFTPDKKTIEISVPDESLPETSFTSPCYAK